MKELTSVVELNNISLNVSLLAELAIAIKQADDAKLIVRARRGFVFKSELNFTVGQLCYKLPLIKPTIDEIFNSLNGDTAFADMRILEAGIGYYNVNKEGTNVKNFLELDHETKHVRVPLSGTMLYDGVELVPGKAYIVDNVTGFAMKAQESTMQLVVNYIAASDERHIWSFWHKAQA
jgi:hypothetical protein